MLYSAVGYFSFFFTFFKFNAHSLSFNHSFHPSFYADFVSHSNHKYAETLNLYSKYLKNTVDINYYYFNNFQSSNFHSVGKQYILRNRTYKCLIGLTHLGYNKISKCYVRFTLLRSYIMH